MNKAILSLSGGADSTTLLAHMLKHNRQVQAVFMTYPSKHSTHEDIAAKKTTDYYGIELTRVNLWLLFNKFRSSLLGGGGDLPEGHYEAESMKKTVVPFRNGIFLSILAGLAESWQCSEVWIGAHAGDFVIYPDCRPQFLSHMCSAIMEGTETRVGVVSPFRDLTKTTILKAGLELGVPYYLTRTCYSDHRVACGRCGACVERLSAFKEIGVEDPLEYQDRKFFETITVSKE